MGRTAREYRRALEADNKSPNTIQIYLGVLYQLGAWATSLDEPRDPYTITKSELRDYMVKCQARCTTTPRPPVPQDDPMTDHAVSCNVPGCRNVADLTPWCCSPCAERMRAHLRELEDYASVLAAKTPRRTFASADARQISRRSLL